MIDYICTGTVLLFVLVCIPQVPVYFLFGGMYIRARFTAVYAYSICVTTAVCM